MKDSLSTVVSRLFGGNQAQLDTWMQRTQSQAAGCAKKTDHTVIVIPSNHKPDIDRAKLIQLCAAVYRSGFALYQFNDVPTDDNTATTELLHALSLRESDQGVIHEVGDLSLLQDLTGSPKGRFPPYQAKAMNWHTDGYYNAVADTVRCFTLHCVEPAAKGGALLLMDDAYLIFALLNDDPELVLRLSHPQAMTLPHNKDQEGHDRPDRTVPVIFRNDDESISMRFTTRSQNIQWRCDETKAAAVRASELIDAHPEWQTRIRLEKGQGIITRNILHAREQFMDAPGQPNRQILRGRFKTLPELASDTTTTQSSTEHCHVAR